MLTGCGGSQLPVRAPGATPQGRAMAAHANSTNYRIVYSFLGSPDGGSPTARLIDVGGTLYGTTSQGGSYKYGACGTSNFFGCGTVFSVTTGGTEKVLHNFRSKDDGGVPVAGLIDVGGTLYGTTSQGGKYVCGVEDDYYGCGTVFSITPGGTETVLHSFGGPSDGTQPDASLIDVNGMLYGTTSEGGLSVCVIISSSFSVGCGTVFSISTGGTETIVHNFGPGRHAHFPQARLIEEDRKLYGTTVAGGTYPNPCSSYDRGGGTVFSVTQSGKERAVHSFGNGADGREPVAGLIEVKGTFYGTTSEGSSSCFGGGTVFSVTQSGTEKVLHSFGAKGDGAKPIAGLIDVDGTLYGTTEYGGTHGSGTVFALKP
jgi:uncharacterized repeat protein (TIGR03803 family)